MKTFNFFKRNKKSENDYVNLFGKGLVEIRAAFTTRCSARCTTCLNSTICEHYDLDVEIFKSFVEQVLEIRKNIDNPMYFSFFNIGESYLHPQFMECCEWAVPQLKNQGIRTSIVTNGSHVDKIPQGIDDFFISFNAGKKETYEKITGLDFEHVKNNIINLYKKGEFNNAERVQIHMLCFDGNQNEENDFKEVFRELKGVEYRFSYKYDNQQEKTEYHGTIAKKGRICCDYLTNKISLYPNGDVHSCAHDFLDEVSFGNLEDNTLVDILKSDKRRELIQQQKNKIYVGICEKCDYNCEEDSDGNWFVYGKFGENT